MSTWREIRNLRAIPPGFAADEEQRREVFGASLQQAEELAKAAAEVGYPTKPILLFYTLCQGFRAACAARLEDDWERSGHGLRFSSQSGSVVRSSVTPNPTKLDLYKGAMTLSGETPLQGEVAVGELLASLFELRELEMPGLHLPRPLLFRLPHRDKELSDPSAVAPTDSIMVLVDGLPANLSRDELRSALDAYPTLAGGEPVGYPSGIPAGVLMEEQDRNGVAYRRTTFPAKFFPVFRFPFDGATVGDYLARYEELAPSQIEGQPQMRVVQPGVGKERWLLGPLTPWWSLLIGLSSLARYYPSQWRKALDIDREPLAPGLEQALDASEDLIPAYVFQALTHP
jgi:hypothetical protein